MELQQPNSTFRLPKRSSIEIGLLLVVLTVLMPVLIPLAIVGATIGDRRKRRAAEAFRCTQCGKLLGAKSVRLADEESRKHFEEMRDRYPLARFRIVKTCHALCATCGMRYSYLPKERTFVPEMKHA